MLKKLAEIFFEIQKFQIISVLGPSSANMRFRWKPLDFGSKWHAFLRFNSATPVFELGHFVTEKWYFKKANKNHFIEFKYWSFRKKRKWVFTKFLISPKKILLPTWPKDPQSIRWVDFCPKKHWFRAIMPSIFVK